MKYFFTIALCLSITLTIYAQDTANTTLPSDDAPYIYYYSRALNGVVIERADGTDSRVIGQGLVEGNPLFIEGAGWSPDGDWFAWYISESSNAAYTTVPAQGYVAHIDGETHLEWMEDIGCVHGMKWHPTENLLLVISSVTCEGYFLSVPTYSIFDVETQTRLNTFSIHSEVEYLGIPSGLWGENYLLLGYSSRTTFAPTYDQQRLSIKLFFDGSITVEALSDMQEFANNGESSSFNANEVETGTFYNWTFDPNVEAPLTPLANSSAFGRSRAASWSANKEWLFVGYEFCVAGCAGIPYRVNIFNPTTGHNREISSCGVHPACVNWLPEHVDVNNLTTGQDYPVLPTWDEANLTSQLNPDFGYATFDDVITHEIICEYGQTSAEVRAIESGEVDFVMPTNQHCGQDERSRFIPRPVIFALSPDEQYYALTDESEFTELYHADTGNLITRLNFYGIRLNFSEDSADLITVGRFASATWDIQRLIDDYASDN